MAERFRYNYRINEHPDGRFSVDAILSEFFGIFNNPFSSWKNVQPHKIYSPYSTYFVNTREEALWLIENNKEAWENSYQQSLKEEADERANDRAIKRTYF